MLPSTAMLTTLVAVAALPRSPSVRPRAPSPCMKGVAGFKFSLDMWYGGNDFAGEEEEVPAVWVSPWAEAHYKLRQQEIEIERCEQNLQSAVAREDYAEAGGLQERVVRLRSQHPLIPREERIEQAIADDNYALAAIFQRDLDAVKKSLGLPQYAVGQTVKHKHRAQRGIVLDVDLVCTRDDTWVMAAGCLERGIAMGYPADQCEPNLIGKGKVEAWRQQPFYVVLPDTRDLGTTPSELACWEVSQGEPPAPLYVSEDALEPLKDVAYDTENPGVKRLFEGYDPVPHRGRMYKPAPRLRLWQQEQQQQKQQKKQEKRFKRIGLNDGTYFLG